jgi:hypothetical protein
MIETQKKELWTTAEVFRALKAPANINDIVRAVLKDQLKDFIKPEYQNTEFVKNIDFKWQSTAPDNSVEYITGSFEINKDQLTDGNVIMMRPNFIDYGDGRSIFIDVRDTSFDDSESTVKKFESNGGIRYFRDNILNSITLAEQHIENYFSVARLLQMKVWWDEIDHANTPKLAAVYQWTASVTGAAIAGQTTFNAPPYTFDEVTQEIASLS